MGWEQIASLAPPSVACRTSAKPSPPTGRVPRRQCGRLELGCKARFDLEETVDQILTQLAPIVKAKATATA